MQNLKKQDPILFKLIRKELERENANLELIASENFAPSSVLEAQGSCLTNKYAEGYPGRRWYGGCEYIDEVENLAIQRAKKIFGAEHINVQPHSGSTANMAVYLSVLEFGDTVLALDLACGGHLTHGHVHNFSGRFYNIVTYGVDRRTEMLDYDAIEEIAKCCRPKMIVAGACAYPRIIDFKKFRQIADKVGAYLFVDMAHICGLVIAGAHPTPVPYAEFVTTTTHKTLRGPRSGIILCKKEFSDKIDKTVFPGIQGGPLMHIIAAKAVAFKLAMSQKFKADQFQTVKNALALAASLASYGFRIVSGGTDTHLLLVDLTNRRLTGRDASEILDKAKITVNKNLIPFDRLSPSVTSGIRLGTPAVTSRGMKEREMKKIAQALDILLRLGVSNNEIISVRDLVSAVTKQFPLYPELLKCKK
jgi:glycine hydroxymethyltransferase